MPNARGGHAAPRTPQEPHKPKPDRLGPLSRPRDYAHRRCRSVRAASRPEEQIANSAEALADVGDFLGFRREFRRLFGFDVPGVDYEQPVRPDVPFPTAT